MRQALAAGAPETTATGFESPSTTAAPDTLFDFWLPRLSGAQLRILLFLIRRCYGPDGQITRDAVAVSSKQFIEGGSSPAGRRFGGCGIRNKTTLKTAAAGLEALGLILKDRATAPGGGDSTNVYRLYVRDHPETPSTAGFRPLNTTPVPNELYDHWLARLGDAELRVLLYIVRHTLGWRKARDVISPEQFIVGIRARDGRIIDEGCGIKTEKHMYLALVALEKHHLIQRTRRRRPDGGYGTTAYSLLFAGDLPHVLRSTTRATPEELHLDHTSDDATTDSFSHSGRQAADRAEKPDQGRAGVSGSGDQSRPDRGSEHDRIRGAVATGYGAQLRPERESGRDGIGGTAATGSQETWSQEIDSQEIQHQQHGVRTAAATSNTTRAGVGAGHNEENDAQNELEATYTSSHPVEDGFAVDSRQACIVDGTEKLEGLRANAKPIILGTEEEIRSYTLADDEVLIDASEGAAQVMTLRDVVCNDILATQDSYLPVRTEVYYSVEHLLGEGGDEWTPDEEGRIGRHKALRAELDVLYKDIGAFSFEEALGQYFTADLVQRFRSNDPSERQRVLGWLRHVRSDAGAGLTNPAGFLRTRIESGQWSPRGGARSRR
jgi:hypothetical protein